MQEERMTGGIGRGFGRALAAGLLTFGVLTSGLLAAGLSMGPAGAHEGGHHGVPTGEAKGTAGAGAPEARPVTRIGPVAVHAPWARPTRGRAGVTAGYMTLINTGDATVVIDDIEALSPGMEAELHTHSIDSRGVARMRPLAQRAIPPGGRVVFAPGGNHVMFLGLDAPLNPGDRIGARLIFDLEFQDAIEGAVTFLVREKGGARPADGSAPSHHHRHRRPHDGDHDHERNRDQDRDR